MKLTFYERPSSLGSFEVRLAIQCNVAESVPVDELHGPLNEPENALEDAERTVRCEVAAIGRLGASNRAGLTDTLNDSNE